MLRWAVGRWWEDRVERDRVEKGPLKESVLFRLTGKSSKKADVAKDGAKERSWSNAGAARDRVSVL